MQSQVTSALKPRQLLLSSLPPLLLRLGRRQEKEKALQICERQSGDEIWSVKSDYMKATDGLQKRKHTTLISHHLWRFVIVCLWPFLGCFYSTERRESNCGCGCRCVFIVDFLVNDPLLPGFPFLDLQHLSNRLPQAKIHSKTAQICKRKLITSDAALSSSQYQIHELQCGMPVQNPHWAKF